MSGPDGSPVIEVEDLHFTYPDGTSALRGLSLSVKKGESVCLAGPNGAGKSTLLLCLAGLLRGAGRVALGGQEVGRANRAGGPPPLGLVFQDADDQLFCPTLAEDVAFGPRNQRLDEKEVAGRVRDSLAAVGLSGFEARSAHHLSGGEKRRAAVAAMLACRPAVMAFGEPWAGLDARGWRALSDLIRSLSGTRLVASQDLYGAAEVCERLVIVDEGRVAADAPTEELLSDSALLEAHGLDFGRRCRYCPRERGG